MVTHGTSMRAIALGLIVSTVLGSKIVRQRTLVTGAQEIAVGTSPPRTGAWDPAPPEIRVSDCRGRFFVEGSLWWLAHNTDPEKSRDLMECVQNLLHGAWLGNTAPPGSLGSLGALRARFRGFLRDDDPAVRGSAAILVGVAGWEDMADDIIRLLDSPPRAPGHGDRDLTREESRAMAATALGLLGASEYKARLKRLLASPTEFDRRGAAEGLGLLGAWEAADAVAFLLKDPYAQVQYAAIECLSLLGDRRYSTAIALKLASGDSDVKRAAMYALARLADREHAPQIAQSLNGGRMQADAAKALAVMGAREYAEQISICVRVTDGRARRSAMLALGMLGATEYAGLLRGELSRGGAPDREYARLALALLMEAAPDDEMLLYLRGLDLPAKLSHDGIFPWTLSDQCDMLDRRLKAYLLSAQRRPR